MFSYRATFQHLYLLLLGDIPGNVYGSPQSDGNLANSVQHSTGILTVTFCVPKSPDYERGIRGGKRKVNLMPKRKERCLKNVLQQRLIPTTPLQQLCLLVLLGWEWFITFEKPLNLPAFSDLDCGVEKPIQFTCQISRTSFPWKAALQLQS